MKRPDVPGESTQSLAPSEPANIVGFWNSFVSGLNMDL